MIIIAAFELLVVYNGGCVIMDQYTSFQLFLNWDWTFYSNIFHTKRMVKLNLKDLFYLAILCLFGTKAKKGEGCATLQAPKRGNTGLHQAVSKGNA